MIFFRLLASPPPFERQDLATLVPMGFLHAVSHLTVVLGLGAGAVSFLQTVKAAEACFTALLSYVFLGQVRRGRTNGNGHQRIREMDPSCNPCVARAANHGLVFAPFGYYAGGSCCRRLFLWPSDYCFAPYFSKPCFVLRRYVQIALVFDVFLKAFVPKGGDVREGVSFLHLYFLAAYS